MAKKELKEIEEEERNNPMKVCTAMYNVMSEDGQTELSYQINRIKKMMIV